MHTYVRVLGLLIDVTFQIFRQRTTTRHDINTFYLESIDHCYKRVSRGNYSLRRAYIESEVYKKINRDFLKQIKFTHKTNKNKTYNGYHLFAVDGLTLAYDNNKQLRKDFKVKK